MAYKKLRLIAIEPNELEIISAACQDGLFLAKNATYFSKNRRFTIGFSRFTWENSENKNGRVDALLSFEGVLGVKAKKINPSSNVPLSILSIEFIQDEIPPSGEIIIKLAQDYEIALKVECLDIVLADIGELREARSKPNHEE